MSGLAFLACLLFVVCALNPGAIHADRPQVRFVQTGAGR